MRLLALVAGATAASAACTQCPLPPLNITGFLPCLKTPVGEDCCATGRPMVTNPCIKVWLASPLLAPYKSIVEKARAACSVDKMAECEAAVATACPKECGVPAPTPKVEATSVRPPVMTAPPEPNPAMLPPAAGASLSLAVNLPAGTSPMRPQGMGCTICPLPSFNVTAFAPCLAKIVGEDCCTMAKPLVGNPCAKVWLSNPMVAAYKSIIMKAGEACRVTAPDCSVAIATVCPKECGVVQAPVCTAALEEFTSCQSSSCFESKCVNGKVVVPGPICTADCRTGCRCQDGAVRDSTGKCIPQEQCGQPVCSALEAYTSCQSSSCFENKCVNGKVVIPGPMCTADCKTGCRCQEGAVRDSTGKCIPQEQCGQPVCSALEAYTSCQSSSCFENKCVDGKVVIPGPMCTADCKTGCRCQDGAVRDSTGKCIPQEQCGQKACAAMEVFTSCQSSSCFENKCVNGKVVVPGPMCTADCKIGCRCQDGAVRDSTGKCISESQCGGKMTPCQILVANQTLACRGMVGCAISQCNDDGSFSPRQCHPSTGYCWCVDKDGKEVDGSRQGPGKDQVNCGAPKTPCQIQAEADAANCGGKIGCPQTKCNKDGSYTPKQCRGSTGYCWCVDKDGKEVDGSRKGPGAGEVNCASDTPVGNKTPCQIRAEADASDCGNKIGCDQTKCNKDGSYVAKQCRGSTGYCWCVDKDGREVAGSKKGPGAGEVNCAADATTAEATTPSECNCPPIECAPGWTKKLKLGTEGCCKTNYQCVPPSDTAGVMATDATVTMTAPPSAAAPTRKPKKAGKKAGKKAAKAKATP